MTAVTAPVVLAERPAEGVGLIRINRPDARNALNLEVRKLLAKHLTEMGEDSSIRCIVMTGNEKAFAAGADIKEMVGAGTIEMLLRGTHKLWRIIGACPKPVIAAVSGFALGGGCELAMTCDIILAGEGARFGQPEVKIGIIPGGGGTQRLPRAVGKYKAMRYLLTGDLISAEEALNCGFLNYVIDDPMAKALEIANKIAANGPIAVQAIRRSARACLGVPEAQALKIETCISAPVFKTEDAKEGPASFMEKRPAVYKGK